MPTIWQRLGQIKPRGPNSWSLGAHSTRKSGDWWCTSCGPPETFRCILHQLVARQKYASYDTLRQTILVQDTQACKADRLQLSSELTRPTWSLATSGWNGTLTSSRTQAPRARPTATRAAPREQTFSRCINQPQNTETMNTLGPAKQRPKGTTTTKHDQTTNNFLQIGRTQQQENSKQTPLVFLDGVLVSGLGNWRWPLLPISTKCKYPSHAR